MKANQFFLAAMLVCMAVGQAVMAQTYQSAGSGNWTSPSTWQVWDDPNWVAATSFPGQTSTNAVVTIGVSHQVYINPGANITIQDINVAASGKVTLHTGGKIIIADKMQLSGSDEAAIVVDNTAPTGTIASLACSGASISGTLTEGTAAAGISFTVDYTGGNSGTHFGQTVTSTGVTGLTAVLESSTFASGNGQLTYNITGTPANSGTATFALTIGGQTCNADFTVTSFQCGYALTFIYRGSEVTYGTISKTYKEGTLDEYTLCWLDRNLGASRVATLSTDSDAYGDLFQWGRLDDGHQVVNWTTSTTGDVTPTTSTLSDDDVPGHGEFISSPFDWLAPPNPGLWQGENGVNNPCPPGWRVPTEAEWAAEFDSWGSKNPEGALSSLLKLPVAGSRVSDGSLLNVGSFGYYWSSTVDGNFSRRPYFYIDGTYSSHYFRASGASVRCLKDN